jgi:hypothetical protein
VRDIDSAKDWLDVRREGNLCHTISEILEDHNQSALQFA